MPDPLHLAPSTCPPPFRCMMESWLEAKLGARAAADEEPEEETEVEEEEEEADGCGMAQCTGPG